MGSVGITGGSISSRAIQQITGNITSSYYGRDGRLATTLVVFPNNSSNVNFRDARTKYRGFAVQMSGANRATREAFLRAVGGRSNTFQRNADASAQKAYDRIIKNGGNEREANIARELRRTDVQRKAIQSLIDKDSRFSNIKIRALTRRDYRDSTVRNR